MSTGFEDWTEEDIKKYYARINRNRVKSNQNTLNDKLVTKSEKSKYGAKKVEIDGIKFDSRRESERYIILKHLQQIGVIKDLQLQVPFELQPKYVIDGKTIRAIKYVADFVYKDKLGNTVVEDSKGYRTKEYLLKKKMFEYKFNLKIMEV